MQVISLLSAATEGAPPSTVACVERAVDMLKTSELYLPQMRDESKLRTEDPIATDLIGALLSVSTSLSIFNIYLYCLFIMFNILYNVT